MSAFGLTTDELENRTFEALGVGKKPLARLCAFLANRRRTGERLGDMEQAELKEYLNAHGYDVPLECALVVQVSIKEVTEGVFGHRQSAVNALNQLCESGIADVVFKGQKDHSTLYFLALIDRTDIRDDKKKSAFKGSEISGELKEAALYFDGLDRVNNHTGEIDPNRVKSTTDGVKKEPSLGQKNQGMGSSSDSLNRGNSCTSNTYPMLNPNNPNASTGKKVSSYQCEQCGNRNLEITEKGNFIECYCPVCNKPWIVRVRR